MEFNQPKGIYQQIADQIKNRIVADEWAAEERIPSIREMAVTLGVNPNTVTRSYQKLLEDGVIENHRGVGYFVAKDAKEEILQREKRQFMSEELPKLCNMLQRLGISLEEVQRCCEKVHGKEDIWKKVK